MEETTIPAELVNLIDRYGSEEIIQFWRDFEAKHLTMNGEVCEEPYVVCRCPPRTFAKQR